MNAISVERAQDLAAAGVGTVSFTKGSTTVHGKGTNFTVQFAQPKCSLAAKVPVKDKYVGGGQWKVEKLKS